MIGIRLKLARTALGMTLRDLATATDNRVSAQAIGMYERDETIPNSSVLIALARALNTSIDYLLGNPKLKVENLQFRKNAIVGKRVEAEIEAAALLHLERYLNIEEILQLPSAQWDKPRDAPYPVLHELIEADRGADSLRFRWELGHESVPNLVEVLEQRGIKVLLHPLGNVDGLTAKASMPGRPHVPLIVVNVEHSGEVHRFTLARELAHLVLDVSPQLNQDQVANRFACAFLMPASALWREVGKHRSAIPLGELLVLKEIFKVSAHALTRRCFDLGIISRAMHDALFDEFMQLGWIDQPNQQHGAMPGEKPTRFLRLCLRAHAEGAINESKLSELLDISMFDVDNYTEGRLSAMTATS